jgi:hypothetical protein
MFLLFLCLNSRTWVFNFLITRYCNINPIDKGLKFN